MIAVVAAVGGEIEGDGEALLPGGDVAAVEGVGILGRGEARVLAHRPRLQCVHRRVGAAQERRDAGKGVEEVESGGVGCGIGTLDGDAFGCLPDDAGGRTAASARSGRAAVEADLGEVRNARHAFALFSLTSVPKS